MKLEALPHLFNISRHEWSRTLYGFGLEFWLVIAHTLGHAILIAIAVDHFGAGSLPYLWIAAAVVTVVATTVFPSFLERFEKKFLIYWLGAGGALALASAFIILNIGLSPLWFFALALVGMAGLGSVLHITISLLVEDLFTPLEAERTFPFISSSALVGGVVAGGAITLLTGSYFHWGVEPLILLWSGAMLMIVLTHLIYQILVSRVPHLEIGRKGTMKVKVAKELVMATKWLKEMPFVRTLAGIVFIQFVLIQLLEFQYASALSVGGAGHSGEHLIHGLGFYGAIFSGVALAAQVLFSRRVVHWVGIVRTMMINPLLLLAPLTAMAANFGVPTAVASKLVHQATNTVARNAYLASFYAIPEKVREHVRPLIEGWLVSGGAIFGTLILIALERIYHVDHGEIPAEMTFAISLILILLVLVLAWRLWYLKDHYTGLSVKNLRSGDEQERYTAIEILVQRGHRNSHLHLTKALAQHKKDIEIKKRILKVLGYSRSPETISVILDHLHDPDFGVRYSAVRSLNEFNDIGGRFYEQAFARYRIATVLQEMFRKEESQRMKQEIMKTFANLNHVEIIPFLLEILQEKKNLELLSDTITVMGSFNDPNIVHYLRGFIKHRDPSVRASAIVALWQFSQHRMELIASQITMIAARDRASKMATIWMLGEIQNKAEKRKLRQYLKGGDDEMCWMAALSLAKMGESGMEGYLAQALLTDNSAISLRFERLIGKIDRRLQKRIQRIVRHEIARRISMILQRGGHSLDQMSGDDLCQLERFYRTLREFGELAKLKKIRERIC